eukprot:8721336-Pyramimonas_sp.AAC.1
MVSSALAMFISSKCLAVRRLGLTSELLVVRCGSESRASRGRPGFQRKALGASLVPVPGSRHCRQRLDSS